MPKEVQTAYDKAIEKKKEIDILKDQINNLQNLEQLPEKSLEELKSSSTEKAQEEIDEAVNSTEIPTTP